ncbi:MAG TPA: hypothetical protein VKR06_21755 [Ktedonosporobacter sp.]|nr:hypothetical protein [Ktedonosporobacter sp.]
MQERGSEVARLRAQIEVECQAMSQALYGYAMAAKHEFINRRYESLGELQEQLRDLVGQPAAMEMLIEVIDSTIVKESAGQGKVSETMSPDKESVGQGKVK